MIDRSDIKAWTLSPVTRKVFELLLERFDHHRALLGSEPNQALDRFRGRAEVLDYLYNPSQIITLMDDGE